MNHNHITRDIKASGKCPACDEYRDAHAPHVAAGPSANLAWHMLALHAYAAELATICHMLMLDAALEGHPPTLFQEALDEEARDAA